MFMDENEKRFANLILNNINSLKNILLSYLNFFSPKSEKIMNSIYLNQNTSLNRIDSNGNYINNVEINKKVNNYFEEFQKELSSLNKILEEFQKYYENNSIFNDNYRNIQELISLFENLNSLRLKNNIFKDKIQKIELIFLIFKHITDIGEYSIVEESLKSEIKSCYNIKKKVKLERSINPNYLEDIKEKINIYIKNVMCCKIDFDLDSKGFIKIKYFPFVINIGLPLKDNYYCLKNKVTIIIKFDNQKEEHDLLLLDKIKSLFDTRILTILNSVYDEKKAKFQKVITFTKQNLLDFITNFLNYLYNYNNIMNIPCAFCNKISKYSFIEKCFYPPYYKLYKISKIEIDGKINERENLFFHEECFRRISNPSL